MLTVEVCLYLQFYTQIYHQRFTFAGKHCHCCADPDQTEVHLQCILNEFCVGLNKETEKETKTLDEKKGRAFSTGLNIPILRIHTGIFMYASKRSRPFHAGPITVGRQNNANRK